MPRFHLSGLLRQALYLDAAASGGTGLIMLLGAPLAQDWLGLPPALFRYAGALLLPYAVFVAATAMRPARWSVWLVIASNAAWAIGSVLLLVAAGFNPTALGYAFVLAQAIVVALFAELQFAGLRRDPLTV